MRPAVTIVIPAYNDSPWIAAALQSCLDQTRTDIEIICVDDASTDGTSAVIGSYAARDPRIRLIEQKVNRSAFQARRLGVEAAEAPFVLFLDGDDELAPDAVEVALERAVATNADVVGFGVDFVMPEGMSKPRFEKEVQPQHEELSGAAILPGLFPVGAPAHGHVWGYLFATELLRTAYADLPIDLRIPRANDLPISFLALADASKYASTRARAYRYFFRRGAGGHPVRTPDDFDFYLGAIGSIELIEAKVAEIAARSDAPGSVLACYASTRLFTIGTVLKYCLGAADEELQRASFSRLRDRVGEIDIVRAAANYCPDALPLFAGSRVEGRDPAVRSVLITTSQLGTGGIQGVIASQARHLQSAGIRVTIAVQRTVESVYDLPEGVAVIPIVGDTLADRLSSWVDICRESEADMIFDHYVLYNRVWPFYVLAAQALGVPTIGFVQSFALRPIRDDNGLSSFLVQNFPLLETVVTLSRTDVAYWKLRGVENVVHLPLPMSPMLAEIPRRTEPKSPPVDTVKLVWWGRLQQSTKQARDLIPITAALRARGVEAELTIIGPDSADLTAARLLKDATVQGVADFVHLMGPMHGSALIEALGEAHVNVFTSVIEGSPLALVEAQALGMPVVMYELPWLANLEGNGGVVSVKQGDAGGLAREIHRLIEDPAHYVEMSAASLEAARRASEFDFPTLYKQLLTGELAADRSPDPSIADARLLLEWMAFYSEMNAGQHVRQNAEIASLRSRVAALRAETQNLRSKFVDQRNRTAELRRKLQAGGNAGRFGRRAKRLAARVSSLTHSIRQGRRVAVPTASASTPSASPDSTQSSATDAGAVVTSQPDVSVIIPVYNAEPWLDECLSSVLGQSGVEIEVICVNDGSTDDSRSILARYAAEDERVRVIDQANAGQSVGRNAGLEAATGRYVIFLDSDDYWSQDALATLVRRADHEALDILLIEGHSVRDGDVAEEMWARYGAYYPRKSEYREVRSGADMIVAMRRGADYKAHVGLYLTRKSYVDVVGARFIPGIVHQDNPYTFALLLKASRTAHSKVDLYARRVRPGSTITTLKALSSAKGYYLSYVAMLRDVTRGDLSPEVASVLSMIVFDVFESARRRFSELPVSVAAELRNLDPSADAQLAYRVLVSARDQAAVAEA